MFGKFSEVIELGNCEAGAGYAYSEMSAPGTIVFADPIASAAAYPLVLIFRRNTIPWADVAGARIAVVLEEPPVKLPSVTSKLPAP